MANDTYRDWIPEGEESGAQKDGYKDFVPDTAPEQKAYVEPAKLTKTVFKCDQCDFQSEHQLALMGHMRSHKAKGKEAKVIAKPDEGKDLAPPVEPVAKDKNAS
jgi:hypothetical protein